MKTKHQQIVSKVPEITLIFWVIKIFATTVGETGGDLVSMSLNVGYLISSIIFAIVFLAVVSLQINARSFNVFIYWATIIATTTLGTTMADFADRSLGIGYAGGSTLLLALLMLSLFVWHKSLGSVSIQQIRSPKAEMFYWVTILFSQTLGTALGDWVADTQGLGYAISALLFSVVLISIAFAYFTTAISHTVLFWAAFIFTRPLGAVVGDFLDKPIAEGGLALSHLGITGLLLSLIFILIFSFKQQAAQVSH